MVLGPSPSPGFQFFGFLVDMAKKCRRIGKVFTAVSNPKPAFEENRFVYRKEAADATSFAAAKAKIAYDSRHQPLRFRPGEKAYLRLHHGYSLPSKPNRKLSNQRTGPFRIKRKVGRLAYELELPPKWNVHPVVSIAQLEPHPAANDPYDRERPNHPEAVEVDEMPNTDWEKNYEVEKIVDRRSRVFGRKPTLQYLIRWKGYGAEFDEWKTLPFLKGCLELVEDYEREHPQKATLKNTAHLVGCLVTSADNR